MSLSITDNAKARLRVIFAKNPDARALRIGVRGGGCSGYSYLFELCKHDPSGEDKVFHFDELTVYVDRKSYFYLTQTELDFVDELMGPRFQFNNPNVTSTCGCGDSVTF